MQKLYVIVRADLPAGAQLAQACHALAGFALAHDEAFRAWQTGSNNLVCLQAPDESSLRAIGDGASQRGDRVFENMEPDYGDSLTALALGEEARKHLSSLPLALRESKRAA